MSTLAASASTCLYIAAAYLLLRCASRTAISRHSPLHLERDLVIQVYILSLGRLLLKSKGGRKLKLEQRKELKEMKEESE